jgi:hypothetical protein
VGGREGGREGGFDWGGGGVCRGTSLGIKCISESGGGFGFIREWGGVWVLDFGYGLGLTISG